MRLSTLVGPARLFLLSVSEISRVPPIAGIFTPPEETNTGPGFNRGSGGGARGRGFEERGGAHARTEGGHFL